MSENTSQMNDQFSQEPRQQPVQPIQPNSNPPQNSTPVSQPQKPTIHARIFDSILRTLGGGPVMVTDEKGNRKEVPQTRSQVGNAIVAAALSGLMTPHSYRDTPYGPTTDFSKTGAEAFQAGKGVIDKRNEDAQKQIDDMNSRRLTTVSNNMKLAQQASAMALQQHKVLDDVVQRNQSTVLKDAEDYDKQLASTDPSQKAILAKGLSVEQAMNMLHGKMTSQNAFIDGTVGVRNPETGVTEEHPTYTILNPEARIKLSKDTTDELAKYDKQYQGIYEATDGNVSVPLRAAVAAMHQANSLKSLEDAFQDASNELFKVANPKSKNPPTLDFAQAYKNNTALRPVFDAAEKALSSGAAPYQVLAGLQNIPGANELFKAMGTTTEAVSQYVQKKKLQLETSESVAKAGGKIEAERLKEQRADAAIEETARNILADPNNPVSIEKISSLKNDSRQKLYNKLEDLSGGTYSIEGAKAKINTYQSFTSADGKDRNQIESYNTFLKHDGNFVQVINSAMKRPGGAPYWVDKPLNWIEQYVGSDPDILEFKARILPVKDEFLNFIKGNKAAFLPEVEEMSKIIDPNQSPRALLRVAQTLGETGLDRLDSKNSTYRQNFGKNAPNLFDQLGTDGAVKLGLGNRLRQYGINAASPSDVRHSLDEIPQGKVPAFDKQGNIVGFADDKKGTNYHAY